MGHKEPTPPSAEVVFVDKDIEKAKAEGRKDDVEGWERIRNMLKTPNPDPVDNSGGGPNDPLINNLGSNRRIRQPFVDPTREQRFGPSSVPKVRNQAVDPNPDVDPNNGAAVKAIRSTSDAATDPSPDAQLQKLNFMRLANLRG